MKSASCKQSSGRANERHPCCQHQSLAEHASGWHHINIYAERTATQTHYISYTIDNVTYPVADQYAWQWASGSSSTTQNVQIQMDINSSPGSIG